MTARRQSYALAIALFGLAFGVGMAAMLGPLVAGAIEHKVSAAMLNQVKGADAVALFLVAPASVIAGVLALRRHAAAPVLAIAPAAFAAYIFSQLAIGQEWDRYDGNTERYFPLFAGLFVLGGRGGSPGLAHVRPVTIACHRTAFAARDRLDARTGGGVPGRGLHLPGLMDAWSGEPTSREYVENPTVFWVVKLMDLGIVVPVALATGAGVLRGSEIALRAAYGVVGWFALLGAAVTAMGIMMLANDDPDASAGLVVGFAMFTMVFAGLAAWMYGGLFGRRKAEALHRPPSCLDEGERS